MISEFNFKSSVCTSREQSERLLALGLKKETSDMGFREFGNGWKEYFIDGDVYNLSSSKIFLLGVCTGFSECFQVMCG